MSTPHDRWTNAMMGATFERILAEAVVQRGLDRHAVDAVPDERLQHLPRPHRAVHGQQQQPCVEGARHNGGEQP